MDLKILENHVMEFLREIPETGLSILYAIIIVAIGILLMKLGRRIIHACFNRYDKRLRKRMGETYFSPENRKDDQAKTIRMLAISLFNVLGVFTICLSALAALGADVTSLLAIAGVGSVAIGFGCQTLVKDFISGMFLWTDGSLQVGDVVTIGGQTGTVERVALRTTSLIDVNGVRYVVPNGDVRTVINRTSNKRTAVVDITIAHGQDYTKALHLLEECMRALPEKCAEVRTAPTVTGYIASDARCATMRVECGCLASECWNLERLIRLAALECLRENEIKP